MTNETPTAALSKCHSSPVITMEGNLPATHERMSELGHTFWFKCEECGEPCDFLPPESLSGKGEIQKVIEDTERFWLNVQEHGGSWPENINAPIYLKIFSYIHQLEGERDKYYVQAEVAKEQATAFLEGKKRLEEKVSKAKALVESTQSSFKRNFGAFNEELHQISITLSS